MRAQTALVFSRRWTDRALIRTVIVWAAVLTAGAFLLQWLEYQYVARVLSPTVYAGLIGTAFAAAGVWLGWKLSVRPAPAPFARNDAAIATLGLTGQELKVLEQLAAAASNKEIGRVLGVSPNTVKTHTSNLYAKLEVGRRTEAVNKARELHILP